MYTYEASRADATDLDAGFLSQRACSKADALPWASVSWNSAAEKCAAASLRLCTAAEWEAACMGAAPPASGYDYPYGEPYDATACNGREYDQTLPGLDDFAVPTGSLATCASDDLVYDLSGNLKEWTDDPEPDPPAVPDGYRARGGAFDNRGIGLACDFAFTVLPPEFFGDNLGFRCCCTRGGDCPAWLP
jgi:formylglycine-generating enzyme required for sulfatase activity